MKVVAKRPESMVPVQTKYCAGCGHGVVHRIICELIDEMGLRDRAIITNPVGCAIWADLYFDFDSVQPHMAGLLPRRPASNGYWMIISLSVIRETAILPPSELPRSFTRRTAGKNSPRSSSITRFTA